MFLITCFSIVSLLGLSAGLPADTIVLSKLDQGLRYQYAQDSVGENHLVDLWLTADDISQATRFEPQITNEYHLFTRQNPSISQPILHNYDEILRQSNFDSSRRTVFLIHGWRDSALSDLNSVLVPALLAAADLNIFVLDWSAGVDSINYRLVILNTINSGSVVADFIQWLHRSSGSTNDQIHLIGHGFGGHKVGIIGRNLQGAVNYITGLDPAMIGWVNNLNRLQPNDGVYTEAIHTNYGINGYLEDLAHVDFYPNQGLSMPGCTTNDCDHARSYLYFAESVLTGGFVGRQCINYFAAILGICQNSTERLHMGGLEPKIGQTGVYLLETNASPPFSQEYY